jgi:HSP20 family molecular chaperone IbpA
MSATLTREETHDDVAQVEPTLGGTTYSPRFDIWENDDEMILYGDLPGVMPEGLDVHFENPVLTIHGKVSPRHNDIKFLHGEYGIGDFHRTFTANTASAISTVRLRSAKRSTPKESPPNCKTAS